MVKGYRFKQSVDKELIEKSLQLAKSLALKAGEITRKAREGEITFNFKTDNSLVTKYDTQIEEMIVKAILSEFPGHDIIAEENTLEKLGFSRNLNSDFVWIVDPIDGTKAFSMQDPLGRNNEFGTAIALVYKGMTLFSVFYAPMYKGGALFYASELNDGAFMETSEGKKRISVNNVSDITGQPAVIIDRSYRKPEWAPSAYLSGPVYQTIKAKFKSQASRPSSIFTMTQVAEGNIALLTYPTPMKAWDFVAGAYIVTKAGGKIVDAKGRELSSAKFDRASREAGVDSFFSMGSEPAINFVRNLLGAKTADADSQKPIDLDLKQDSIFSGESVRDASPWLVGPGASLPVYKNGKAIGFIPVFLNRKGSLRAAIKAPPLSTSRQIKILRDGTSSTNNASSSSSWPLFVKSSRDSSGHLTSFRPLEFDPDITRAMFTRMKGDFSIWMVSHILRKKAEAESLPLGALPQQITSNEVVELSKVEPGVAYRPTVFSPELFRHGFAQYGYREHNGIFKRVASPKRLEHQYNLDASMGHIGEPLLALPDTRHPAIFVPHTGHGCTVRDVSESGAIMEGLQDARGALNNINKFNDLIKHVSLRNYLKIISDFQPGRDSFWGALNYSIENNISDNFFSLLYFGVFIYSHIRGNNPNGKLLPIDYWFLQRLLQRFSRDNYPQANSKDSKASSPSNGLMRTKELLQLAKTFAFSKTQMQELISTFINEARKGLVGKPSSLSMLPKFQENMLEAFKELVGDKTSRIKMELTGDGSGIGAAIIAAAVTEQQKASSSAEDKRNWLSQPTKGARLVQETLRSLGKDFTKWWFYQALRKKARYDGFKGNEFPLTISADEIRNWSHVCGSFLFDQRFKKLENYGYVYEGKRKHGVFVLGKPANFPSYQPPHNFKADKVVGVIKEPSIKIPQNTDPAIYVKHMGSQQSYWNDEIAEWEGRNDAACAISYLKAYNKLIAAPTANSLFEATIDPRVTTGPYDRTMEYLLNNGISGKFLQLLHSAFRLQWILDSPHQTDPFGLWMFQRLLERFCRDNYGETNTANQVMAKKDRKASASSGASNPGSKAWRIYTSDIFKNIRQAWAASKDKKITNKARRFYLGDVNDGSADISNFERPALSSRNIIVTGSNELVVTEEGTVASFDHAIGEPCIGDRTVVTFKASKPETGRTVPVWGLMHLTPDSSASMGHYDTSVVNARLQAALKFLSKKYKNVKLFFSFPDTLPGFAIIKQMLSEGRVLGSSEVELVLDASKRPGATILGHILKDYRLLVDVAVTKNKIVLRRWQPNILCRNGMLKEDEGINYAIKDVLPAIGPVSFRAIDWDSDSRSGEKASSLASITPSPVLTKQIDSFFDDGYFITYFDHPVRGAHKFYGTDQAAALRSFKGAIGVSIRNFMAGKFRGDEESGSFNICPSPDGNISRKLLSAILPHMSQGAGRGVLAVALGLLLLYGDDDVQKEFFINITNYGVANNFKKLTDFRVITKPDTSMGGKTSLYEVSGTVPFINIELLNQWRRRNEENRRKITKIAQRSSSSATTADLQALTNLRRALEQVLDRYSIDPIIGRVAGRKDTQALAIAVTNLVDLFYGKGLKRLPIDNILQGIAPRKDALAIVRRLNNEGAAQAFVNLQTTFEQAGLENLSIANILEAIAPRRDVLPVVFRLNNQAFAQAFVKLTRAFIQAGWEASTHKTILQIIAPRKDVLNSIKQLLNSLSELSEKTQQLQDYQAAFSQRKPAEEFIFSIGKVKTNEQKYGSFFVVDYKNGQYIALTNTHVVGDAKEVTLYTTSGVEIGHAKVVIRNANPRPLTDDIAVLAIASQDVLLPKLIPINLYQFKNKETATMVSGFRGAVSSGFLVRIGDIVLLLGASAQEGDSGSPYLVERNGKIYSVAVNARKKTAGMLLSPAVKSKMLQALEGKSKTFLHVNKDTNVSNAVKEFLSSSKHAASSAALERNALASIPVSSSSSVDNVTFNNLKKQLALASPAVVSKTTESNDAALPIKEIPANIKVDNQYILNNIFYYLFANPFLPQPVLYKGKPIGFIPVFLNRKGSLDTAIKAPPAIELSKSITIKETDESASSKHHTRIIVPAEDFSKAASNEVASEIRHLQKDRQRKVVVVFATGNTM
ncbi:MAG: hypothetical protein M0R66_08770, partial [Candidatus Omnitrophica bacterium]|nr:hypothetical protein [Candidatus Omnitrophota bacterium]